MKGNYPKISKECACASHKTKNQSHIKKCLISVVTNGMQIKTVGTIFKS